MAATPPAGGGAASHRAPYWSWRLDRWRLLVAAVLVLLIDVALLLVPAARNREVPVTPDITSPPAGARLVQGALGALQGVAGPGQMLRFYEGDKQIGETTAGAEGAFRLELPDLAPGGYSIVARSYGPKGQALALSQPLNITVAAARPYLSAVR